MVVVFCVSLCSCVKKPTKEELIVEANRYMAAEDVSAEIFDINSGYSADYNGYYAIVSLDVDYICSEKNISDDEELRSTLVGVENDCEESIDMYIDVLYEDLSEIFDGSDVEVRVGYMNVDGEFVHLRISDQE